MNIYIYIYLLYGAKAKTAAPRYNQLVPTLSRHLASTSLTPASPVVMGEHALKGVKPSLSDLRPVGLNKLLD